MKVRSYLDALATLPVADVDVLTGGRPMLVLSPHPDDETLGCGGLLLQCAAAGVPAHVAILTDGAASHRESPTYPPEKLAALRRDEARRAVAWLDLPQERLHFFDLPDAATPASGPAFEAAVDAIVRLGAAIQAGTLFVTWGRDPHCDHETAFAMARDAARRLGTRLWAYPVWGLHLPPDADVPDPVPRGHRLDIAAEIERKRRALDCYASQTTRLIDDDPEGFCFTAEQLAPFFQRYETFVEVEP